MKTKSDRHPDAKTYLVFFIALTVWNSYCFAQFLDRPLCVGFFLFGIASLGASFAMLDEL